jgi:hypothetical protein
VKRNNLKVLALLFVFRADMNQSIKVGDLQMSILHLACRNSDEHTVFFLLMTI